MAIGVPSATPSTTPDKISTISSSLRGVVRRLCPGRRRRSSSWISSVVMGSRGGQPSRVTPTPPPCDSPQVEMRKTRPQVFPTPIVIGVKRSAVAVHTGPCRSRTHATVASSDLPKLSIMKLTPLAGRGVNREQKPHFAVHLCSRCTGLLFPQRGAKSFFGPRALNLREHAPAPPDNRGGDGSRRDVGGCIPSSRPRGRKQVPCGHPR